MHFYVASAKYYIFLCVPWSIGPPDVLSLASAATLEVETTVFAGQTLKDKSVPAKLSGLLVTQTYYLVLPQKKGVPSAVEYVHNDP